jgi:SM-20-related protein
MSPGPALEPSPAELADLAERGAFVRDGFLGAALAGAVRAELARLAPGRRPARMGRGGAHLDPAERGDELLWLDEAAGGPALAALRARLDGLGAALAREARLALGRREVQVAWYPGGGARYARHRDAFRDGLVAAGPRRRLTAILYLNPGWEPAHGGELRLHLPGEVRDVAPALDRLVVFLSERVEHEVRPVHAPRLAVTAWFHGP